ncbi:FAD/NAD(P)-binding domain-containing protein [Mycena maculata]|uniref:FAD/NAD(P)-binding domain-containing protein n=1 Tax=Mycena maculata TaxID=230809 RepID=A0AAD7IVE9_9AGAR|nr:FAD/NAD(P)-binding domain-containing protein [Mycena maculata]
MSQKVVIVGAGPGGGSIVARTLSAKLPTAQITLINPLPYAISRPTLPRMTVSDGNNLIETALIPFDKLFTSPNGTFVQGVVESIRADKKGGLVVLTDGQQFAYDVLVLAPGSIWEGPLEFPTDAKAVPAFVDASRAKFKKAQKIVLVGGGAVGVEYAGEIKDIWPGKEVTIVHGDAGIMNSTYSASFRKGLEKGLGARGINLILNDYVDEIPAPGPTTVTTRRGHVIDADLVISARGPRPRTEFIAKSLGADSLDERNQIKVKPTLQLSEHPDIFAVGDAINTVEQKQVMKASAHAALVAGNIVAYLAGKSLKEYKGSSEIIVVTNGKNGGRAYFGILWGITLGDWFARLVKSKTLLVSLSRGSMGY